MKSSNTQWMLKLSTFFVVSACFTVLCAAMLTAQNLQNVLSLWGEDVQLTVYLSEDIKRPQIEKLEAFLKQKSQIAEVKYVDQNQAFQNFKSQLSSYAPDLEKDDRQGDHERRAK